MCILGHSFLSRTPDRHFRCFYPCEIVLSHTPIPAIGKYKKNRTAARLPHVDPWRHCFVIMTSPCRISAYSGFSGSLFHIFSSIKWGIRWWARKRIHYSCEGEMEKSVPRDHRLPSLGKPPDANRWSSGQVFSIPPSHSWWILIVSPDRRLEELMTQYQKIKICSRNNFWSTAWRSIGSGQIYSYLENKFSNSTY